MLKGLAFWASFWVAFWRLDVALDRRGLSASKVWRWLFRTHTRPGRVATISALGAGTATLVVHLNRHEGTKAPPGRL